MKNQIYFIAIIPPENISDEINKLRKQLLPDFNIHSEHKKFPHITLQHTFRRSPEIEPLLTSYLNELAQTLKPFNVTINNCNHFDSLTLYIAVNNNNPLQNLYKQVKNILVERFNFPSNHISNNFTPHITLEKKLTKELFTKGWNAIEYLQYKATFTVTSFSLMKHNGIKWEPLHHFKF